LHERRKQVVRLQRKKVGVMWLVELTRLSYPTVRGVIDRYERGGVDAIKPTPFGTQAGNGRARARSGRSSAISGPTD